jgi:hypothetical protein
VAISEGETQKAENMFRDFVELSSDEVILIDAYAGEKLLNGKLTHVPKGVDIKILTSDRVFQGSNAKKSYKNNLKSFNSSHTNCEVKYLNYNQDWSFHDRYIIRDREKGYSWGHSFKDSGKKQHSPTEIKQINLEKIINDFKSEWRSASNL